MKPDGGRGGESDEAPVSVFAHLRKLSHRLPHRQFIKFQVVGVAATLADWGMFYLAAVRMAWHYQLSLAMSLSLSTMVHFTLNKLFTFRCASKQYFKQLGAHVTVSAVYLVMSMGVMYILVDLLTTPKMASKIITTGLMMTVSYTLHKYVTFNKRIFKPPEAA